MHHCLIAILPLNMDKSKRKTNIKNVETKENNCFTFAYLAETGKVSTVKSVLNSMRSSTRRLELSTYMETVDMGLQEEERCRTQMWS